MTALSYSTLPVAGATNNASDVITPLNEVKAVVNALDNSNLSGTAGITDANLASPNNSVYRPLLNGQVFIQHDDASGLTRFFTSSATLSDGTSAGRLETATSGGSFTTTSAPYFPLDPFTIYLAAADFTVAGKTTKLRVRANAFCNATAPGITYTVGLYPVTVAGGADTLVITAGAVVASSAATLTTPSASTVTSSAGSDITIPADGMYALGWTVSGALANNAAVMLSAQLQLRHV